jgi:hypothetical protein
MNKLELNQVGGFPMTTKVLDEIQKAHAIFNALGAIAGDVTIISGCIVTGSNVSDGVVFINGEVFEFRGGLAQTKVRIVEEIENLTFQNGNSNPVIKTRYVTFGSGVGAIDWSNFKRAKTTVQLTDEKAEKTQMQALLDRIISLEARPVSNVPIGLIAVWDRPANEIPNGWVEHIAMKGRIPIGFDADDIDFDVVGKQTGAKTKQLSIPEMPEHTHGVIPYAGLTGTDHGAHIESGVNGPSHDKTGKTGGGQPFSIMNPVRTVHFIRYTGIITP